MPTDPNKQGNDPSRKQEQQGGENQEERKAPAMPEPDRELPPVEPNR